MRRRLVVLSSFLIAWGGFVIATGGFSLRYGTLSFRSRSPWNPWLLALLVAGAAWAAGPAGRRAATALDDWRWLGRGLRAAAARAWRGVASGEDWLGAHAPSRLPAAVTAATALFIVALGFAEGAFVAAGSDAWGYLSQADMWRSGSLRVEQPLMRELSAQIPREALAPLAYRPAAGRAEIVPVVGPGLPMVMALFQLAGGRDAAFFVVPLLAGLAIVATHLIASRLGLRWAGPVAAVLLAASPSFLFQLSSSPMSDIPAAAWWALALAGLLASSRRAGLTALAAGLAAGLAVLTRPNLVPLVAVAALLPLSQLWRERSLRGGSSTSSAAQRLFLFIAGIVPAVAVMAALNAFWYGSPLAAGYGSLSELYQWTNIGPNLARYPRWLVESQTPLILLAAAAPLCAAPLCAARRGAVAWLLVFSAAVLGCYVAYAPFDVWWFVRFLLPAYPPLLALTAVSIVGLAARLPRGARLLAVVLVVCVTAVHTVRFAAAGLAFDTEGEMKYAIAGRYVADHVPERAVLFTMQHSGSARYYSGRITIRWDLVPYDRLAWTIGEIRRQGYAPYALIEDWEEDLWRKQAGGLDIPGLTQPPIATLPLGNVRLYELSPP